MFEKLFRMFNYLNLKFSNQKKSKSNDNIEKISKNITDIKKRLEDIFSDSSDFILREITLGEASQTNIIVAYMDGLVDKQKVDNNILQPLMIEAREAKLDKKLNSNTVIDILKKNLLTIGECVDSKDFKKTIESILSGDTVVYIEETETALKLTTKGWESRSIEEPQSDVVIKGPREGFVETLGTNISLLRRKIKNPNLKFQMFTVGEQTKTDVCICYIKGLANEEVIDRVKRRLDRIETDAILESGYIEEFIEDAPLSIFPTVGYNERPDVTAGKLLEGRVAILCAGTPFVLTVPYLFIETIQFNADYYLRPFFATFVRLLRLLALIITFTLPAFYVAVVSFHQDMIPFDLLTTIASATEGVPFSAFTEVLLMGATFEFLQEAGVRLPKAIGQAVSIVGALVLGQAAVEAGLSSNPVIMVTAITGITSFIIPRVREIGSFIRIGLLFAANILGFLGIGLALTLIFMHLCTLKSFGVPYLAPMSPLSGTDLKDAFVRVPLWSMWTRPKSLGNQNKQEKYRMNVDVRQKED